MNSHIASLPMPAPIELIVLTGFLGSGKTTLLSAYLRQPQAVDTAVIVNEIGEVDLDGAILSTTAAKVPMALLSNGCVCCAMGDDLPGTIAAMFEERAARGLPSLARIVLETTGLARPGPVLRSLGPLAAHLRAYVVSTFDCERGAAMLELPEAAAQIAGAQRIVLTRQDVVGAGADDAARTLLAHINPLAEVVAEAMLGPRALAAIASPPANASLRDLWLPLASGNDDAQPHHSDIRTALCRFTAPVTGEELAEWLDNLAGLCGDRLLRVKGLVRVQGSRWPLLVQCVGTLFSPLAALSVDTSESFLVVIARGMYLDELRDVQPSLPIVMKVAARDPAAQRAIGRPLATVLEEASA